jgi:formate dehydrogenase
MPTQTTFCRICEALCGLEADTENGLVKELRPDPAHVTTDNFACPKGLKQHRIYQSPDRLTQPLRRRGQTWEKVSWEEALREIGQRLQSIKKQHGPESIAMYVGTAAGFSALHPIFAQGFMLGLGSHSLYSTATQDCSNKFATARALYGFPFTQPFPDLDHTQCLIIVGANPVVSKWSFLQVPNPGRRLREITDRGGEVFFLDPRLTESAKTTGTHYFIRPGTDVFFYLSFLRELIAQGGIDRAHIDRHSRGFSAVEALCQPWTAERTARVTGISPETLSHLVTRYRQAKGAVLYSSTGVNMGGQGALCFWLQEVINFASGNLDKRGGTLVGEGIFDFPGMMKRAGMLVREATSRVGGYRSVNDAFPGGILADEILTPGAGQVRALLVTGGNPLITMPNAEHLRRAFSSLDLLVTIDIFRNETGQLADFVLPATSPLERPDLPFLFPLFLGMQRRPYLQATRPVAQPPGEVRDEVSIFLDLCRAAKAPLFGSRLAQWALEGVRAFSRWRLGNPRAGVPQEWLLDAILRLSGQGSFSSLLAAKHGRLRPNHQPGSFLGKRVLTDDGKLWIDPPQLLLQARQLESVFETTLSSLGTLRLITKRAVTTHNSWTHNLEEFANNAQGQNFLYMHPEDAARAGLRPGDLADVTSQTATVRIAIKHLPELMPGVVALPHGWGHQHAEGLSVARRTRGVNVNLLAADGPGQLEPSSGMAHLTGIPVTVRPAAGPQKVESWSGL